MINKGVSKVTMIYEVTHQDYPDCLYNHHQNYINYCNGNPYYNKNDLSKYTIQHSLGSNKLKMYEYESNKVTMNNIDDKLWIDHRDGIITFPHSFFNRSS